MKKLMAVATALLLASSYAVAGPQQEKMKMCNKEAGEKNLKGTERKAFMRDCLHDGAPPAPGGAQRPQQEKMKMCNKDAKEKGLKGPERKDFMKSCLSGAT